MGRLKRSCVVGSVVFHVLILATLVLGPMLLAMASSIGPSTSVARIRT